MGADPWADTHGKGFSSGVVEVSLGAVSEPKGVAREGGMECRASAREERFIPA